jgi:multidrug efflux pump subunit AcrB
VKRLIGWFATNSVAANFLLIMIVAGGLFTIGRVKQEVFPEIRIDTVTISVPYRGAAPEEVEEGVCIRVEEAIQAVEGIKEIRSTGTEGLGVVVVELEPSADIERAVEDIKAEVDAIDTFPAETEEPIVKQAVMRTQVINVAVAGEADERTLRHLGQTVRDELVEIPGITHAELANARPYEVSIEVSEQALRRHGLTFDEVVAAVQRSSLDLSGGSLKTAGGEILLRTKGQAYTGGDFETLPLVVRSDGTRLLLGDVATVVDGFEDTDVWARFDGRRAVLVQVFRVGQQGALDVAAKVKAYVREAQARMPDGIVLTTWEDNSLLLQARLDTLIGNARLGFFLVLLVLALFLRLRLAFWVGLGVPVAVLGTVMMLPWLDVSVNLLSLFAFLVVLGILVDDAIVVGENVHTHQEQMRDPMRAAITGATEVAVPVIFGVLTTVAAFSPLLSIPGAMGKLVAAIPLVVVTALVFSLIESQLILPAHLAHGRTHDVPRNAVSRRWKAVQGWVADHLQAFVRDVYRPFVERAIAWRYLTAAVGVAVLIVTIGMIQGRWVRFVFMPNVEGDNVVAFVTMPLGTPAEVTEQVVTRLERSARAVQGELDAEGAAEEGSIFHHILASIGEQPYRQRQEQDRTGGVGSSVSSGHQGEVNIELASAEHRRMSSVEVANRWRERTGPIPDAVELAFTSSLFSAGDAINVQLKGADVTQLAAAAEALKRRIVDYPGVFDVADSFRGGKQELKLRIHPTAEELGLSLADLARQVRQAFYGEEAQRIQRGRDEVRVMVRYPAAARRSLGDVEDMRIRTPEGSAVPFSAVAGAELGRGFATIQRADRRRVVSVTADVDETVTTPNEVVQALRADVLPEIMAAHPRVAYSMQGEQREQSEFLEAMRRRFYAAMLVIFALLAVPLRSYVQPLIIMTAIPFGMVGAIWGHVLMGWDLSMFSIIGMVALSGVVVNDSLVLVDYVNRLVRDGIPLREAIASAGGARFRAILLTSLTTFAGLSPLLLERSLQAQFLIPMAISLAFGVVFSTAITLVLVPAVYLILEDVKALVQRPRTLTSRAAPVPVAAARTDSLGADDPPRVVPSAGSAS